MANSDENNNKEWWSWRAKKKTTHPKKRNTISRHASGHVEIEVNEDPPPPSFSSRNLFSSCVEPPWFILLRKKKTKHLLTARRTGDERKWRERKERAHNARGENTFAFVFKNTTTVCFIFLCINQKVIFVPSAWSLSGWYFWLSPLSRKQSCQPKGSSRDTSMETLNTCIA